MKGGAYEAAVAVVQQEVTLQCHSREIIHAAGAKGDVPHDEALINARKPGQHRRLNL